MALALETARRLVEQYGNTSYVWTIDSSLDLLRVHLADDHTLSGVPASDDPGADVVFVPLTSIVTVAIAALPPPDDGDPDDIDPPDDGTPPFTDPPPVDDPDPTPPNPTPPDPEPPVVVVPDPPPATPVDPDPDPGEGWSNYPSDTRHTVFVANGGTDNGPGTREAPLASVAEALRRVQQGQARSVLFRRGDVFDQGLHLGGHNDGYPRIFGAYGDPQEDRPIFDVMGNGIHLPWGAPVSHLRFLDLDFQGSEGATGFDGTSEYQHRDILVEGCRFSDFGMGIVYQRFSTAPAHEIFTLKRCVIKDIARPGNNKQGLYVYNVNRVYVAGCFFDRIGSAPGYTASQFDHAVYFDNAPRGNVDTNPVFQNNVIARSDGVQLRDGGLCHDNVFIDTWIAVSAGIANNPVPGGVAFSAWHNALMGGGNINPGEPRGWGFRMSNIRDGHIHNNLIANNVLGGMPMPFSIESRDGPVRDLLIAENDIIHWSTTEHDGTSSVWDGAGQLVTLRNNRYTADSQHWWLPNAAQVTRQGEQVLRMSVPGVANVPGNAGDSKEALLAKLAEQRRYNWNEDLTGARMSAWLRESVVRG